MEDKIKSSIMIDRRFWKAFKSKVGSERELRALSQAVEEANEDEISGILIIKALEKLLGREKEIPLIISPVKPKVVTDAGKAIRELRGSRF
ncbi:MAG: hypothetical protein DRJ66_06895 [Thermoprotei archaeon]|nr:MAG: hypothetical protein DRJ66_06895 [Thermoprotei archaeon]RLF17897.1 MAG: hypothetical protein DRZ82_09240 [Thermoprotei archaeon]